jgi:hypothetical protein
MCFCLFVIFWYVVLFFFFLFFFAFSFFRTWEFFADRGLNPKLSIYSQVSNYPTAA